MHRVLSLSTPRADTPGNHSVPDTGPLFVAYLFSWGLYGVLSVQTYLYYMAFPDDRRLHKWLVYSIYFLETSDTVFLTYDALSDFRNMFGLSVPVSNKSTNSPLQFSWLRLYIFGGIVTCMVQTYYAHRLNFLRRSKIFSAAVFLAALTQSCAGIIAGVLQANQNFYTTVTQTKIPTEIYVFGIASATCGIIISAVMTHQLLWEDTDWQGRHPFFPKVVRLSIETGMVAALAAITYVALTFCYINALGLLIPALLLSKIYSNSLLLSLNSRMTIAQGRIAPTPVAESALFQGSLIGSRVFPVQVTKRVDVEMVTD